MHNYIADALSIGNTTVTGTKVGLLQVSDCICPDYTVVYVCTIMGGDGDHTVWKITAFDDCLNVILVHNEFEMIKTCNNKSVVAKGISLSEGYYTSQLNLTVSHDIIGQSIECIHDDTDGGTLKTIGKMTVSNETGNYYAK